MSREALSAGQVDEVVASGVAGEVFEPRHTTHGFQFVQVEGLPGGLAAGAHPQRRRAHRPPAHRVVHLQRRPGQPAPRGRGLELPGQRLRGARPTARSGSGPAGPATGRSSPRPRPSSTTSPGSAPAGSATSPPTSGPTGGCRTSCPIPPGPKAHDHPVASYLTGRGGLGRRRRARAVGHVGGLRRRALPRARLTRHGRVGRVRGARRPGRPPPDPGRGPPSPDPTRVPLGHAASTGASGASPGATPRASSPRRPTSPTSPPPTCTARPRPRPHRGGARPDGDARRSASSRPTSSTPGGRSSSTPTERCGPTPRPTCPGARVRAGARGAAGADGGAARRADPGATAPTWRPGSSRRRTSCRSSPTPGTPTSPTSSCSRTRVPSWLAMIDARRHDDLGELGGHRRRRRCRVPQPLQQGRGHHLPAPLRGRHPARRGRPRVPPVPRRAGARAAG